MKKINGIEYKTIAFQGMAGAYSDLACRAAYPELITLPCVSFEAAFRAVREGKADLAMIPVDNSLAGRVADVHNLIPNEEFQCRPLLCRRGRPCGRNLAPARLGGTSLLRKTRCDAWHLSNAGDQTFGSGRRRLATGQLIAWPNHRVIPAIYSCRSQVR
ncbi:MAG: hypothetical protein ACD_75C02264G0001 [uncultured bacterium]|nr:MAG: hypothetical protein ACD_75C02264G0001 [uncultured bacterium]